MVSRNQILHGKVKGRKKAKPPDSGGLPFLAAVKMIGLYLFFCLNMAEDWHAKAPEHGPTTML